MKTNNILYYLLLVLMLGVTGCGSDDEDKEADFYPAMVGEWEMEYSYPVEVLPGNSIFVFRTDRTLTVNSKSEYINDTYLLPSGTYTYSVTKDEITFSGNAITYKYKINGDVLQLNYDPEIADENAYPIHLEYRFHKK